MSVLHNNPFLLASGNPTDPTFPVQRSLRFRSSATAYFNRTPSTAGNRTTWTWSAWIKRGALSTEDWLFSASVGASLDAGIIITSADTLGVLLNGNVYNKYTSAVFRDPSAWYHIVVVLDTNNTTPANRIRFYVNGVEQTAYTTQNSGLPTLGYTPPALNNNNLTTLGGMSGYGTSYFDGYLTEVNFIDGQALTPLSFGGYNPGTGVWEPRKYTGTYGTNGFYLNFQDNSAATAAAIGKDSSGNGNNWTPNGVSLTAGVTYDSMVDVPTLTSGSNANFAVGNPLNADGSTWSGGNLNFSLPNSTNNAQGTMSVTSGKWYWEVVYSANPTQTGVQEIGLRTRWTSGVVYASDGTKYVNGTSSSYGATYTTGDIIGVALDMDASTVTFYKNNTSQGSISLTGSGCVNATFTTSAGGGLTSTGSVNFGQRPFSYTPPSGFKSLNTYNLPEPTIPRGDKYFKQYLYTGNGGGLQVGEIQKPASLFNLDRSLRFRSSNSAYLSRTPASATNRTVWTLSTWVKRGTLGADQVIIQAFTNGSNSCTIKFTTSDQLQVSNYVAASLVTNKITTAVYRDPSAWYHVVIASNGATSLDVYVNGIQATSFATNVGPTAANWFFNGANSHVIGREFSAGTIQWSLDGYLADFNWIDGYALTPTSFGQFDGNNYWTPKEYTGTYGTNGFHLEFEDYSASSATAIGKDTSGNNNNWTPNAGINLTAPANTNASWDSMVDVPTQTSTDAANFCVVDPLFSGANGISNANLTVTYGAASIAYQQACTSILNNGKFYFEANLASYSVGDAGNNSMVVGFWSRGSTQTELQYGWRTDGTVMRHSLIYFINSVQQARVNINTTAFSSTDILGIAFDIDAGIVTAYKNGTQVAQITGVVNSGNWSPMIRRDGTSNAATWHMNFGQRGFKYPVTGFGAINSFNIAEVTGDVETPDLVRIKSRSATTPAMWFNSISGVGKYILGNNNNSAEATDVNSVIQFNKNGLLIGNNANINTLNATYIADVWKAGDSTVTNTAGSITSQVRANRISGVSVVTYTNSTGTVGHGLNAVPAMIIYKGRGPTAANWTVMHKSLVNMTSYYLNLNTTGASTTLATAVAAPTLTTFGTNGTAIPNSESSVAFVFAEIDGFSKFGSYLSNGSSTDGPFVYTGFRPRWVMIKQRDATRSWIMYDTTRNTYNVVDKYFFMEGLNNNEQTAALLDINSNGFKLKNNNVNTNTTANSVYIYMAFAEHPFKYALAR